MQTPIRSLLYCVKSIGIRSYSGPNAGKCGPKELRTRTIEHWNIRTLEHYSIERQKIEHYNVELNIMIKIREQN